MVKRIDFPPNESVTTLRLILGDQLNQDHSWYKKTDPNILYVMAELKEEVSYVKHHVQKICGFFSAMQCFANHLQSTGHRVLYLTLDDTQSIQSAADLLESLAIFYDATQIDYQRPDEYRILSQLRAMKLKGINLKEHDSEHFLVPFTALPKHFRANKAHRMESFYRKQRKLLDVLMNQGEPLGGQWNYDVSNRRKLKTADLGSIPSPLVFTNDVTKILSRLQRHDVEFVGTEKDFLAMPIDRRQSLDLLNYFCENLLPKFGDFQDAMTENSDHSWSLYHSRLSFSLNTKILHPKEVIETAINAFNKKTNIDISQIEGFVRQILGWREFIRGIYWANMPEYSKMNALDASQNLPNYFWTGETQMNCIAKTVRQSLDHGYAHHIQRLMVTGVFGLIAGINPEELDHWYLGIYSDAIEWVELPNTRGMSQFADNGLVASKPYAASGNYINKMSDYCKECHYNVKEKTTEDSCPFNSLYWDFMVRNQKRFEKNPRIGMVYRTWDKLDNKTKKLTQKRAKDCIINLKEL